VYKKAKNNYNALVSYKNISPLLTKDNNSEIILNISDRLDLVVQEFSMKDTTIKLKAVNHEVSVAKRTKIELNDIFLENIRSGGMKPVFNSTRKGYYFVQFTGSWCLPCKTAKPSVDSFFKKYQHEIDFITVAVENSFNSARGFLAKEKYNGSLFYINLKDTSKMSLKHILNVNVYPFFSLIDNNGNIIIEASGSDGVQEIRKTLKLINPAYFR
jgi:thiol-disulfide isomerase/thioredoxin